MNNKDHLVGQLTTFGVHIYAVQVLNVFFTYDGDSHTSSHNSGSYKLCRSLFVISCHFHRIPECWLLLLLFTFTESQNVGCCSYFLLSLSQNPRMLAAVPTFYFHFHRIPECWLLLLLFTFFPSLAVLPLDVLQTPFNVLLWWETLGKTSVKEILEKLRNS